MGSTVSELKGKVSELQEKVGDLEVEKSAFKDLVLKRDTES
jgi:hypothetical protein